MQAEQLAVEGEAAEKLARWAEAARAWEKAQHAADAADAAVVRCAAKIGRTYQTHIGFRQWVWGSFYMPISSLSWTSTSHATV